MKMKERTMRKTKPRFAPLGTVSHGTMRPEDLI